MALVGVCDVLVVSSTAPNFIPGCICVWVHFEQIFGIHFDELVAIADVPQMYYIPPEVEIVPKLQFGTG